MDPKDIRVELAPPPWVVEIGEAARKTQEAAQAFKVELDNLNRIIKNVREA